MTTDETQILTTNEMIEEINKLGSEDDKIKYLLNQIELANKNNMKAIELSNTKLSDLEIRIDKITGILFQHSDIIKGNTATIDSFNSLFKIHRESLTGLDKLFAINKQKIDSISELVLSLNRLLKSHDESLGIHTKDLDSQARIMNEIAKNVSVILNHLG